MSGSSNVTKKVGKGITKLPKVIGKATVGLVKDPLNAVGRTLAGGAAGGAVGNAPGAIVGGVAGFLSTGVEEEVKISKQKRQNTAVAERAKVVDTERSKAEQLGASNVKKLEDVNLKKNIDFDPTQFSTGVEEGLFNKLANNIEARKSELLTRRKSPGRRATILTR